MWNGKDNKQITSRALSSLEHTPTLLVPRYASRVHLRLVVQTILASSGQNEIDVNDSNRAV
jgi:hypothetical protein